ncbi:MAG: AAA family ATPase [Clostridia bacterium]|nr:AAA family ATPase [Clostridia bacterium]
MHRLILKNVGPIEHCDINIDNLSVLTGTQASGKSTIAKSILFFRTIKDDLMDTIIKKNLSGTDFSLINSFQRQLRSKFLQIFGTSRAMNNSLYMKYEYNSNTFVSISLQCKRGYDVVSPNFVYFEFSQNINNFIKEQSKANLSDMFSKNELQEDLNQLFSDDYETIFIPAGRSLITLLTTQLNYIFTIMDEEQKRSIDFCTQKYIERILKIRPAFEHGILGYLDNKKTTSLNRINYSLFDKCMSLIDRILKGRYIYVSGEERLELGSDKYVKINYTSSGQQESVWIFNILMYQLINNTKTFLILEEPEAHLFPNAQKDIIDLLSLFMAGGNSVFLTTHSPYILGSINNLLFANHTAKKYSKESVKNILDPEKFIDSCGAYFLENHSLTPCLDDESNLIKNEVIDEASQEINELFDKLLEMNL